MKGHIFNLLEEFIIEVSSVETYEEILDQCQLITTDPFIRPGTYPDADLAEIVDKTCKKLGLTTSQAHRAFGKWVFPHLTKIAPPSVTTFKHPKELFIQLDRIHQVEVKKLWSDATPPRFYCVDTGVGKLSMTYDSRREMNDLVEGVLESVADTYKVKIDYTKNSRAKEDYHVTDFALVFTPAEQ